MRKQSFIKASVILMLSAVAAKGLGALFKIPLTNILGGIGMSYFSSANSRSCRNDGKECGTRRDT